MVLVVIYLAIAFEWRMAVAALVALIHDLTITVGVYALVGFEVTPGTVIGLLTILGYSLYDTVVVFDSLKESTKDITKQTRFTYSEIANRSLNSTLVRSINTTVVALLPVAGLLFIGGGVLGAGMLNDISLSLFVGLAAGAYSSIFIATPLVADLKEREPQMKALKKRVLAKRAAGRRQGRAAARPTRRRRPSRTTSPDGRRPRRSSARAASPRPAAAGRGRPSGQAPMTEHHRATSGAAAQPHPGRAGLPGAGRDVQGHHPAAGRPGGVHRADRRARRAVPCGTAPRRSSAWRRAASSWPPRSPSGPGSASSPYARRASSPEPRSARRTSWSTAPPRSRCTPRTCAAGDRVLVIDDVLATGGTAEASLELIRRAGAEVAGVAVLMELGFLGGRGRLEPALAAPRWRH